SANRRSIGFPTARYGRVDAVPVGVPPRRAIERGRMKVHLVDGTYELFRQHFGAMNRRGDSPREPGPYDATIGVLTSTLQLMEEALVAMGVTTWAMVEWEADDALGSAADVAAADDRVEQVLILTPDKDLGQCVSGDRVVQYDRRKREILDEAGVIAKFGIGP